MVIQTAPHETMLWRLYTPLPASRNLIAGVTGGGKSLLECALIEQYNAMHPSHINYVIDVKDRFYAEKPNKTKRLFPEGWDARVHGKRLSTAIRATQIDDADRPIWGGNNVVLVKEKDVTVELIRKLFRHGDYNKKVMLWFDELLPFCPSNSGRLVYEVRQVLQLGRERGIGAVGISQRLIWLDSAIASQASRVYIGMLETTDDLEKIAKLKGVPGITSLRDRMAHWTVTEDYHFIVYDRKHGIDADIYVRM
jgi:DNA helicase HerA-like ATPase